MVYAIKVAQDGITPSADYKALVADKRDNIRWLADEPGKVPETIFVDVVTPL